MAFAQPIGMPHRTAYLLEASVLSERHCGPRDLNAVRSSDVSVSSPTLTL
jgi:hypothetical protein